MCLSALLAALTLLLAGCPGGAGSRTATGACQQPDRRLSIGPSRDRRRQNTSVVLHVDTPDLAEVDLPSGYAFDLDEVAGHIDVTTTPCPAGTGSRACEDWTVTPRSDSVPGFYFVIVETVGSRAGRASESFVLSVIADPAPNHGAAVRVAGARIVRWCSPPNEGFS